MRSKFNAILLGILVIQAIVAGFMYSGHGQTGSATKGPWLQLEPDQLSELVVTGHDNNSVTLKKTDRGWRVPAKFDFPVDQQRLQGLIGALNGARPDLPVAISKEARKRFHVATGQFERHLLFKNAKGTVADLYLGTRAGSGRVYARLSGGDAIQNLRFPMWRASANAADWLDKGYLEPDPGQLQEISLPNVTLTRTDNVWLPQKLPQGRLPDQGKISALVDRLRTLRWQTLVGKADNIDLPAKPTFRMTVTPEQGDVLVYQFYRGPAPSDRGDQGKSEGKDEKEAKPTWRVTRSGSGFVFTIDDDRVEPLLAASKAGLSKLAPISSDTGSAPASSDDSAPAALDRPGHDSGALDPE